MEKMMFPYIYAQFVWLIWNDFVWSFEVFGVILGGFPSIYSVFGRRIYLFLNIWKRLLPISCPLVISGKEKMKRTNLYIHRSRQDVKYGIELKKYHRLQIYDSFACIT